MALERVHLLFKLTLALSRLHAARFGSGLKSVVTYDACWTHIRIGMLHYWSIVLEQHE